MKDLDLILPSILPYAPGCADQAAYFGIRQAAIEFCERTRLWRAEDEFAVSADGCDAIMAPYGAVIHEIEHAAFNGSGLDRVSTAFLDQRAQGWRTGSLSGQPHYLTQTEPNTVRVVPRAAGTLTLHLYLKPAQDADELPDWMIDQYREPLAHGALARILLIPNQSFTNVELGAAFGAAFQSKLDGLSTKGTQGQQRAPLRTRPSYF